MVIGIITALIIVGIATLLRFGRAYWLISGYNTMSKAKKRNVDVEGLGKFLSSRLFLLAGLILVTILMHESGSFAGFLVGMGLLLTSTVFLLIGAQRFDHNPRTAAGQVLLYGVIILIILMSAGILTAIYRGGLPPEITLDTEHLSIGGIYGTRVDLDSIYSVELRDSMPTVQWKLSGYSAGNVRKGLFLVGHSERARLYLETDQGPYLFISVRDRTHIIINFHNPQKTVGLYTKLRSALQ